MEAILVCLGILVLGTIAVWLLNLGIGKNPNKVILSIPGDGFRSAIPPDGMPMQKPEKLSPPVEYYSGYTDNTWKRAMDILELPNGNFCVATPERRLLTKSKNRVRYNFNLIDRSC